MIQEFPDSTWSLTSSLNLPSREPVSLEDHAIRRDLLLPALILLSVIALEAENKANL